MIIAARSALSLRRFPWGSAVCVGFLLMYKEIEYMSITGYAVWLEVHFDGPAKQARASTLSIGCCKKLSAFKGFASKDRDGNYRTGAHLALRTRKQSAHSRGQPAFPQKRRRNQRRFREIGSPDASCLVRFFYRHWRNGSGRQCHVVAAAVLGRCSALAQCGGAREELYAGASRPVRQSLVLARLAAR